MIFAEEKIKDCIGEAAPLLDKHWAEIAHYKDINLNPDYEQYFKANDAGFLKCFTARCDKGKLIGYAVYFIKPHVHYRQSIWASQDVLFIDKEYRGRGGMFIFWCDDRLREAGIQVVTHHVKAAHNWGRLLERGGYDLQDLIYTKRLDK